MKYTEQRLNESTAHGYLVRKRQALKRLVLEAVRLEDALGEALLELLARAEAAGDAPGRAGGGGAAHDERRVVEGAVHPRRYDLHLEEGGPSLEDCVEAVWWY